MSLPQLRVLTLNVTELCDAACCYCQWWQIKAEPEPLDVLLRAVDQAAAIGTKAVRISGGEPLLRPDLPTLVAHIRKRGLIAMVCTAAKCEAAPLLALLDAGLDVLSISLDTLDPKVFHRIRGYEIGLVLKNLSRFAESHFRINCEIILSVVITRPSLDGLAELLQYARSLDLLVSITPFQDAGLKHGAGTSTLGFSNVDESRLRSAIGLVRKAAASGVRIINADEFLDGAATFLSRHSLPVGYACHAGDAAAIRMAGGRLKLCHSLEGIPGVDLAAAWNSDEASVLRERMARLDCPGCWLSCHADQRRPVAHRYGRPEIWEAL